MMHFDYKKFELPFEYPFEISKGLKIHQPTLLIFLGMGAQYGLGEATAIHYYNNTIDDMIKIIDEHRINIVKYAYNGPERFWHYLHHLIPSNNFLISALDSASWDMWSKLRGLSLFKMLGYDWKDVPKTDYTLGISSLEDLKEKINKYSFDIYKYKSNGHNDIENIKFLVENTNATIRIDANESWSWDYLKEIKSLLLSDRIDLIEQPFHRDDIDTLIKAKEIINKPFIADESFTDMKSYFQIKEYYDGFNIKLSKCGGITPAIDLIKEMKKNNHLIMLGSMSESNVGAAALSHLLPMADFADIDGPILLKENIGTEWAYLQDGTIVEPVKNGIGVEWKP